MRVLKLHAENIKRLKVVNITPDPTKPVVQISGKNGQGKSSAIDSIAIAIGGANLIPQEPIRAGETRGEVTVDLGEFIVTRKFRRERSPADCIIVNGVAKDKDGKVVEVSYGPTTSTLTVVNKDGAKYPSPQAVLDKLLGNLTFDPLAFIQAPAKEQNKILRRMLNIDTATLDADRKTSFELRTDLTRQFKRQEALLKSAPIYNDVPETEIPVSEISKTMEEANALREAAATAKTLYERQIMKCRSVDDVAARLATDIENLKAQIRLKEDELVRNTSLQEEEYRISGLKQEAYEKAKDAVPDVSVIQARLAEIEETNTKVRANIVAGRIKFEWDRFAKAIEKQTKEIEALDKKKADMLLTAKFPIPGLGLSDEGVTFNGLPLEQAGTAEQLRVSVAIGLALNPTLKVILIKNGNVLDEESLAAITQQAEIADAQLWMEWVSSSPDGVSVMIEDGSVKA